MRMLWARVRVCIYCGFLLPRDLTILSVMSSRFGCQVKLFLPSGVPSTRVRPAMFQTTECFPPSCNVNMFAAARVANDDAQRRSPSEKQIV